MNSGKKQKEKQGEGRYSSENKTESRREVLKAILLAAFVVGAMAVVRFSPLREYANPSNFDQLRVRLSEFHAWAPIVFLVGGAVAITLGAPRSIVSILGGMAFGFLAGTSLALGASLLGSIVIFLLARWLGRSFFKHRVGKYLKTIRGLGQVDGFLLVVLLRQLPLTCMLVNVLIGLTSVSTGVFFLGSIVGLLPEAAIFSLFGSSVRQGFILRVSIATFLLILLVMVIRLYYKRSSLAGKLARGFGKDSA